MLIIILGVYLQWLMTLDFLTFLIIVILKYIICTVCTLCNYSIFLSNQQGAQDKSKRIDRDISKDQAAINKTIKLLMLGAGESGKSTIIKQMRFRILMVWLPNKQARRNNEFEIFRVTHKQFYRIKTYRIYLFSKST